MYGPIIALAYIEGTLHRNNSDNLDKYHTDSNAVTSFVRGNLSELSGWHFQFLPTSEVLRGTYSHTNGRRKYYKMPTGTWRDVGLIVSSIAMPTLIDHNDKWQASMEI